MSDSAHQDSASQGEFDLSQFHQVFFEEASDNLSNMEQLLLALDVDAPQDEDLNAIFRCAHSIKGGAATFGFADVTELTHNMENLLDRLRRHELAITPAMVDTLLTAGDQLTVMLGHHQSGDGQRIDTSELVVAIRGHIGGAAPASARASAPSGSSGAPAVPGGATPGSASEIRVLDLTIGPVSGTAVIDMLVELFSDIPELGKISAADDGQIDPQGMRRFEVTTASSDDDLLDLFSMHVAKDQVRIAERRNAPAAEGTVDDFGLFDIGAAATPAAGHPDAGMAAAAATAAPPQARKADAAAVPAVGGATIRVSVEKVDQLINLMGELVITQAMLAQTGRNLDKLPHHTLMSGLADLERSTRLLQEAVMSMRMTPMAFVFNRFPRMLRDLASRLGKKVEIHTQGEATELDKGLIEKITDPLTHLLRNSVDHGIEPPADRVANGKTPHGNLYLSAAHQGGSIVIEVADDGRGLNRDRILAKARENGLPVHDGMSDADVYQLIFAPGFSTAEQVTDVSGRGVGMDVVKRNIADLGGVVTLDSTPGHGTRVSVRLPLTLAIMDGMSVAVGGETYILPLSAVVESFQADHGEIRTVQASARVVEVRGEFLPVITLDEVFGGYPPAMTQASLLMVVVRVADERFALQVDELQGQLQVVVKNLETNYHKVAGVSGATIMGDGRVALILDTGYIASLVARPMKRAA